MKALEFKIFDVLTERITVLEFENWLYNSEYLNKEIQENIFLFEVLNINYKDEKCLKQLLQVIKEELTSDEFNSLKIISNCKKIVEDISTKNYITYVKNIIENYDYETELNPLNDFYYLYNAFDGYDMCIYQKCSFDKINLRTKSLAKTVLLKIEKELSITEITELFKQEDFIQKADTQKPKYEPILVENQNKSCFIQKKLILCIKSFI